MDLFDFRLKTAVKFGSLQCSQDAVDECKTSMNAKLEKLGLELQKDTQTFREKALKKIEHQLETCTTRYEAFGKDLRIKACKKTSLNNILDQHFAVRLKALPTQGADLLIDDDAPDDLQ